MRSVRLFRNDQTVFGLWGAPRYRRFGRISLVKKKQEDPEPDPYEGNYGFQECDQYTKVTVIGAAGRVGRTLSLLLKTCPLIDHLCLFDTDKSVKGVGVDISHIDTKCCVSYEYGMRNIHRALDAPNVVIIAAGCPASPNLTGKKLFEKNAPIVAGLSEACARFCPKACVVLITSPINSLLPVMGEVYQLINNCIPAKRLFGLTTLDVVRANTFVAEVVRKNPNTIIVPVIGGASQETLVPVLSQMKPCCRIKRGEVIALTECLKRAEGNLADCQNCGTRGASSLSTAYAGFRFTSSLVMALKGAEDIVECAFVKSNVIPELEYLASPVKLGVQGIEFNFGYPPLSDGHLQEKSSRVSASQFGCLKTGSVKRFGILARGFHTSSSLMRSGKTSQKKRKKDSFKDYLLNDRKKMKEIINRDTTAIKPVPQPRESYLQNKLLQMSLQKNCYKNLNASAKQKLRAFNAKRKFPPSASAVLLVDLKKKVGKDVDIPFTEQPKSRLYTQVKEYQEKKIEYRREEQEANITSKDLIVQTEADDLARQREYIGQQLQELKKENEMLKKKLVTMINDKKQEDNKNESEGSEMERTRLQAYWVLMSSTVDAVTKFCKKFTSKSEDKNLDEEENEEAQIADEEEEEEEEPSLEKREKYYEYLENLVEGPEKDEKKERKRSGAL